MKKKMKMKKYEGGGDVYTGDDEIVKYRMGMTEKKEEPKAEAASRDFDSTDSETPSMDLPAAKAVPKKTAAKLTPKAETPTAKEEPKAAPNNKESAFKDSPTAFKDSSSPFKGGSASAAAKEEPKERSLPRGQAKANEGVSSFIKKSMDQIGQEGRDQEARYKATQAKMKESGENLSPRMKAAKASEKAKGMDANNYSMKKGGKVKSASARADGCAIRGKTRA